MSFFCRENLQMQRFRCKNFQYNVTYYSVPNPSDELIFVKRRALDGPFLDKNTGFRRAHRRAKFKFLIFLFLSKFAKKVKIEQN